MTDPISINPNPIFANPLNASASLSNPAAKPMGIGKSKPSTLEALDNYKSFTYYPSNKYSMYVAVFYVEVYSREYCNRLELFFLRTKGFSLQPKWPTDAQFPHRPLLEIEA